MFRRSSLVAAVIVVGCAHQTVINAGRGPLPSEIAAADGGFPKVSNADVEFMSGMIGHHAQAIVMAKWADTHGASQSVKVLAGRIIVAQTDEIGLMQTWLKDRKYPVPVADPAGWRMTMNGQDHVMAMPGMLTEAQMKELDAARGADYDRLFLRYMIQHHQGAITMVDKLFGSTGGAQDELVFKFASDVYADQSTEIARMQSMLETIPAGAGNP